MTTQSSTFAGEASELPSESDGGPVEGRLLENIMYFARALRAAGVPVGPGKVLTAAKAVEMVGLESRTDLYWTLHSVFVNRRDQKELFDQAFHVFWRNPQLLERMIHLLLPSVTPAMGRTPEQSIELSRRLADALRSRDDENAEARESEERLEIDAALTYSGQEVLQKTDFEKMSQAEFEAAKRAIKDFRLPIRDVETRRTRTLSSGRRADLRATMRAVMRGGGDTILLKWKTRRRRPPPLVLVCDISGSMSRYSRMLLHFMHAVTNDRDRVHSFVFGTRLTNITRYLRERDVDVAIDKVADEVQDWSGGTRIGACLHEFNAWWGRRVLAQGAVVLLISDGLDRDNAEGLERETERLHKSCRRLIWLNPLLRWEGYQPKSQGARVMVRHIDDMRTVHNLESLQDLCTALSEAT